MYLCCDYQTSSSLCITVYLSRENQELEISGKPVEALESSQKKGQARWKRGGKQIIEGSREADRLQRSALCTTSGLCVR